MPCWNLIKLHRIDFCYLNWYLGHELYAKVGAQLSDLCESQLIWWEYVISFKVGHNVAINNMFHDFTTNRDQGHRSVVRGVLSVIFLECWTQWLSSNLLVQHLDVKRQSKNRSWRQGETSSANSFNNFGGILLKPGDFEWSKSLKSLSELTLMTLCNDTIFSFTT